MKPDNFGQLQEQFSNCNYVLSKEFTALIQKVQCRLLRLAVLWGNSYVTEQAFEPIFIQSDNAFILKFHSASPFQLTHTHTHKRRSIFVAIEVIMLGFFCFAVPEINILLHALLTSVDTKLCKLKLSNRPKRNSEKATFLMALSGISNTECKNP